MGRFEAVGHEGRTTHRGVGLVGARLVDMEVLRSHSVRRSTDGAEKGTGSRWEEPGVATGAVGSAGTFEHGVGDARGKSEKLKFKDSFRLRAVVAIVVEVTPMLMKSVLYPICS